MNLIYKPNLGSLLMLGVFSLTITLTTAQADLPKSFDYSKASANYVDKRTNNGGGGSSFFDSVGNVSNPYYFGGTIGPSEGSSYCSGESGGCEDKDTAWKAFGGYKLMDKISAEVAYVNLGDLHKNGTNSDISGFSVNAVGNFPLTEQFDIFGKLGSLRWSSENTDGDESGFGMMYGVGAKMHLNESTNLRLEWEKFPEIDTASDNSTKVNMLSIGVELSTY